MARSNFHQLWDAAHIMYILVNVIRSCFVRNKYRRSKQWGKNSASLLVSC